MSKPLAIVVAGRTFPSISAELGDFEAWIARGVAGHCAIRIPVCDGVSMPDAAELSGVIISGSHEMITDRLPWSEALGDWLKRAVPKGLPILGICYGHQLLAQSLGGVTGPRREGVEFGTVDISLTRQAEDDLLFQGMAASFPAHVIHYQSVLTPPQGATPLAASPADPHQALRYGPRCWGLQFHPEFDEAVIAGYSRELGLVPLHSATGQDAAAQSRSLLRRFAGLCHS